ncbi:MAG: hypothetical protein RDU24_15415, partial [Humidesulfovibrio sp.]|uniref:hypothetical protein n=1 Tax=Humidesulfovibrio sp. TaxID=2910988 RepID=UPI0027EABA4E
EQALYEEGGLSGGTEVRGEVSKEVLDPVPPPEKASAEVTWKNDVPNREPTHQDLEQKTRDSVENLRKGNPELDSLNVNSGKREVGTGPHTEGRAVDINKINGVSVGELAAPKTPEAERARKAAENMVAQAKKDPNVNQVLGPSGCWGRDKFQRWRSLDPNDDRDRSLIEGHRDHYHINVYRK